ncbi:MAG: glycosyltransferase family 39 protein [Roseiarcus sp.]|jgi:hypothetical protein
MTGSAYTPLATAPGLARPPRRLAAPQALAWAGIVLTAVAWTALVRLPLWRMDGLDDPFYVEVARLWSHGLPPYLTVYDVKPPGFFALLALFEAALGPTLDALRALAVVCDAATAVALLMLGRRFGAPAVGLFSALLYPLLCETVTANDAYCPLATLTTFAFVAALSRRPIVERALVAGLLIGAAGTVKQTAGFEALALLAVLFGAAEAKSQRARVVAAFLATAAAAPLAFLAYFALEGGAGALIADAVVGALERPASASEGLSFVDGIGRFFLLHKSDMALFAVACLALMRWRALAAALPDAPFRALASWFAAAAVGVVIQRSNAPTYIGPMIAPSLLIAGLGLTRAAPELRSVPEGARLAALGVASFAIALLHPGNDLSARLESSALAEAASAIRADGWAPDDRLYVVNRGLWALQRARSTTAGDPLPQSWPHLVRFSGSRSRAGLQDLGFAPALRRRRRPAHPLHLRAGRPLARDRRGAGSLLSPPRPRRRRGRFVRCL